MHTRRLQFRGEVDPGSEDFWNRVTLKKYKKEYKEVALEIREERTLYTVEQANTILEKLFRAGERCSGEMMICVQERSREKEMRVRQQ
jgi:hypothetical protein